MINALILYMGYLVNPQRTKGNIMTWNKDGPLKMPGHVSEAITGILKNLNNQGISDLVEISRIWNDAFDDFTAENSKPLAIKGKTLVIQANNSPLLQEMILRKEIVLHDINSALGRKAIDDIRLESGDF